MPKLRICVTMSAGWKKNSMPGKRLGNSRAQFVHVFLRRPVVRLQGNQDFGIHGADRARIAVGQIDAAIGQADVVEDGFQFGGWHDRRISAST